jgi:hypothetical protein
VPHSCQNDMALPVTTWHGLALIGQLTLDSWQKPRSKCLLNRPFKAAARVRIPLGVLVSVGPASCDPMRGVVPQTAPAKKNGGRF